MDNLLLKLNLQYFAEKTPSSDATETNPVDTKHVEAKVDASDGYIKIEKTFSQAELDEIIAKRISRVEKKYEGFDDLKAKVSEYEAKFEEQRLSELSEKEQAVELAKKFEAELNELKAQLEAKETAIREQVIKNEFIKVATSANIIDIDAAIALSDLSAVSIGDDGAVVGVDDVIKTLVENKPYLVAKKQAQPIGQATNVGGGSSDKTAEQLLADAAEKARKSGTIADKVAYAQLKKQLSK